MNWRNILVLFSIFSIVFCLNERPIVGILTQPTDGALANYGSSYIAASYVKFVESGGARVVPVFHNSTMEELDQIFSQINGILFPGGGSNLDNTPLFKAGQRLYNNAIAATRKGDYFPVFGHCQGFELLAIITSQDFDILSGVDAENLTLALDLTTNASNSRWLGDAPENVIDVISSQTVTMNNHVQSVSPSSFAKNQLLSSVFCSIRKCRQKWQRIHLHLGRYLVSSIWNAMACGEESI